MNANGTPAARPRQSPDARVPEQTERATFAWPGNSASQPIDRDTAESLSRVLTSIAEPSRLRILSLMASHDPRPMSVTEITQALGCAQSTASHHLKLLVEAGVVQVEHTGNWRLYRANSEQLARVIAQLTPNQ